MFDPGQCGDYARPGLFGRQRVPDQKASVQLGIDVAFTGGSPSLRANAVSMNPDHQALREKMVRTQLRARRILDPRVLRAMAEVPRHAFVPDPQVPHAYEDRPLVIDCQQTISQPYMVAVMTEALQLQPADRVLEVGTGSGYQAAVLASLVEQVYTLERFPELSGPALSRLSSLGYVNVEFAQGDGWFGWLEQAPFDAILVACSTPRIPAPLVEQLRPGRRMVIPIGPESGEQQLVCLTREPDGSTREEILMSVRFVPLLRGIP